MVACCRFDPSRRVEGCLTWPIECRLTSRVWLQLPRPSENNKPSLSRAHDARKGTLAIWVLDMLAAQALTLVPRAPALTPQSECDTVRSVSSLRTSRIALGASLRPRQCERQIAILDCLCHDWQVEIVVGWRESVCLLATGTWRDLFLVFWFLRQPSRLGSVLELD